MSKWYEQAAEKLETEAKAVKGNKENAIKKAVKDTLLDFCRQNEEFAQAVAQGEGFDKCLSAVVKNVGGSISDLDAYQRAVEFYFAGAKIELKMALRLTPADPEPEQGGRLLDITSFF